MEPDVHGGLQRQQADLKAALAATTRQLRKARASARAHAREWVLSESLQHTALIIYVLAGHDADPAARYLATAGRVRQWPEKPAFELLTLVEDLFLASDVDELVATPSLCQRAM